MASTIGSLPPSPRWATSSTSRASGSGSCSARPSACLPAVSSAKPSAAPRLKVGQRHHVQRAALLWGGPPPALAPILLEGLVEIVPAFLRCPSHPGYPPRSEE